MAAAFAVNFFSAPGILWSVILYTGLYYVSLAGIEQNLVNVLYNYVPLQYFEQGSVLKNACAGVCGFLATVLGSRMLSTIQDAGNSFLGFHIYSQQLFSLIAFLLIFAALVISNSIRLRYANLHQ